MTELAILSYLIEAIPQDMLVIGFNIMFQCPPQAKLMALQEGVLCMGVA